MWNALLVAVGAALWSTDTLFRHPLVSELSPFTIVYYEHLFACAISFIYVLSRKQERTHFFPSFGDFLSLGSIGILGSAGATVLFTMSFQYINPSLAILLQKIQPIFVILLSSLFLREKCGKAFFFWAFLALLSSLLMSFPHGIHLSQTENLMGVGLAALAAILWAVSTTIGKTVLHKTLPAVASFWRFSFGLLALYALKFRVDQMQIEIPFVPHELKVMRSLFLMALIPGFMGVSLYYTGLKKVPASVATILELSFPLTAIAVNAYFLNFHLSEVQLIAGGALLLSMVGVSSSG